MVLRVAHELLLGEGSGFVMRRSRILRRETSLGGEIPPDMKFSVQKEEPADPIKKEPADPVKQAATSQDTGAGTNENSESSSSESAGSDEEGNL